MDQQIPKGVYTRGAYCPYCTSTSLLQVSDGTRHLGSLNLMSLSCPEFPRRRNDISCGGAIPRKLCRRPAGKALTALVLTVRARRWTHIVLPRESSTLTQQPPSLNKRPVVMSSDKTFSNLQAAPPSVGLHQTRLEGPCVIISIGGPCPSNHHATPAHVSVRLLPQYQHCEQTCCGFYAAVQVCRPHGLIEGLMSLGHGSSLVPSSAAPQCQTWAILMPSRLILGRLLSIRPQ